MCHNAFYVLLLLPDDRNTLIVNSENGVHNEFLRKFGLTLSTIYNSFKCNYIPQPNRDRRKRKYKCFVVSSWNTWNSNDMVVVVHVFECLQLNQLLDKNDQRGVQ